MLYVGGLQSNATLGKLVAGRSVESATSRSASRS